MMHGQKFASLVVSKNI